MEKWVPWMGRYFFVFVALVFSFSANAADGDPSIEWGPEAGTMHLGTANGDQEYGLNLSIQVSDPKGLVNIQSVSVIAPDTTTVYSLYDDGNHCDNDPNDGFYAYECGGSNSNPPQMGTYTFTVTNKNDPPQSVSETANISTILDLPTNPSPSDGEFVNTATPIFTWGAVDGAIHYNLHVQDPESNQEMWSFGEIATPSAVYNEDMNGTVLQTGKIYEWGVGAYDDQGNSSWYHTVNTFVYSTTDEPVLGRLEAGTIHMGMDGGDDEYGLNLRAQVIDPNGLENIDSVVVSAPDSTTVYPLYDDGNHCDDGAGDGLFAHECGGNSSIPPQMGTYTFTVTNKNDPPQSVSQSADISTILELPTNLSPGHGSIVNATVPTFSWAGVNGAISYNLEVRSLDGFQDMWWIGNVSVTSVAYNEDGSGTDLQTGQIYNWGIGAWDGEGNSSWYHTVNTFMYNSSRKIEDTWYDRFDEETINRYKWDYWAKDIAREIRDGQLHLNLAGDSTGTNSNNLHLSVLEALDYLEAEVLVESDSHMSNGASGYARIAGYFYNASQDGSPEKPYDGYLGDTWIEFKIVMDDQGQLKLNSYIGQSSSVDGNQETVLLNEDRALPIAFDTSYTLSIQVDWDNAQIIFSCNDQTYSYPVLTDMHKPFGRDYKLRTRLYATDDAVSSIKARYDNVFINKGAGRVLYDDFSSPTIDMTKWQDKEVVNEINDGALRLVIRGLDENNRTTNQIAPILRSNYLEAKVSVESGSIMNGPRGVARLSTQLYNDTYGEGSSKPVYQASEGEVFAAVYLQMNPDNTLVAKAFAERADDPNWNKYTILVNADFTTQIELDQQYRLSIELKDKQLIFKCDDEKIVYPVVTAVYPSNYKWLALTNRVYAGTDGFMKASFDDIRLWNREYGLEDLITVLRSLAGSNLEAVKDIDDFNDDSQIGVADGISIFQYLGGSRNWAK